MLVEGQSSVDPGISIAFLQGHTPFLVFRYFSECHVHRVMHSRNYCYFNTDLSQHTATAVFLGLSFDNENQSENL